jgi:hypothetical protein
VGDMFRNGRRNGTIAARYARGKVCDAVSNAPVNGVTNYVCSTRRVHISLIRVADRRVPVNQMIHLGCNPR